ncbi:MAG: hypothetical protein ACQETE_01585 [Bacteroidota bacterium]
MARKYAANPADFVRDNPKKKQKKRGPKTMSSYNKFVKRHRKAGKSMKEIGRLWRKKKGNQTVVDRVNPSEAIDTGKNLATRYALPAIASVGVVKGLQFIMAKYGNSLPAPVQKYGGLAIPAIGAVAVGMYAGKSTVGQAVAGGMTLIATNELINTVMPKNDLVKPAAPAVNSESEDLAGLENEPKFLGDGEMKIGADGIVYDNQGNAVAYVDSGEVEAESQEEYVEDPATYLLGETQEEELFVA